MKTLPKQFYKYFWDTQPENIDARQSSHYVITRLMDYGNTEAARWMWGEYGQEIIKEVLLQRRGISRPSANYWANKVQISPQEVKCLQVPYRAIPFGV